MTIQQFIRLLFRRKPDMKVPKQRVTTVRRDRPASDRDGTVAAGISNDASPPECKVRWHH